MKIFNGFFSAAKAFVGIAGIVNTTTCFLKLVGLMKDSSAENLANILFQLQDVRDTLADMERKLDNLTDTMNRMEAETAFRDRAQNAILYNGVWRDFSHRYMEDGLDKLMTEYQGMLLDGLRSWCRNENGARKEGGVDNTQITLYYNPGEGGWQLLFTSGNGMPDEFLRSGRWVRLPASALPESMAWNVNTYRARLEHAVADSLRAGAYESGNWPSFDNGNPTEEEILRVASDAADLLAYRIACVQVDKNSVFALEVKRQFENYCAHLVTPGDGLSAVLNTFYLTHAFEFEVKDELQTLCDDLILKTGTYGTFVTSVLGMSGSVMDNEKTASIGLLCDTLIELGRLKDGCVTGRDLFCYITNMEVSITELTLQQTGRIYTDLDGSVDGYLSYSMGPVEVNILRNVQFAEESLVGDSDALLILYTMRSNGLTLDNEFAQKYLLGPNVKNYGTVVTSLTTDENLALDGRPTMVTTKVIGDYFTTGARIGLNNLPEDLSADQLHYHRKSTGSVIDLSNGARQTGRILMASAVFGESHWYWWDDEAAFFAGPADGGNLRTQFETVCTKNWGLRQYYHDFTLQTTYNCLVNRPINKLLSSSLNDLAAMNNMEETVHEWDEGTVIVEPTCTEPGVILYRAVDDPLCIREEEIQPLGHEWDEGTVIREPGEAEAGLMQYTCLRDPDHTCTETIDPEGEAPPEETTVGIEGLIAIITGGFDGLYARISLDIQRSGESGLFLAQGEIREDGTVVIPDFRIPGVVVRGVSVALVRSLDDITSPSPDVVASDFEIYG